MQVSKRMPAVDLRIYDQGVFLKCAVHRRAKGVVPKCSPRQSSDCSPAKPPKIQVGALHTSGLVHIMHNLALLLAYTLPSPRSVRQWWQSKLY
jgi:hypothetical protein